MSNEITKGEITGDWDELVTRRDLAGHKVRIIILDEEQPDNPWLKSLRAWADSHKPLGLLVDDCREAIY